MPSIDDGVFVDEAFERVLTAWQVEEALRMLSDEHRGALVEVHYKGRAYGDVAAELGRPGRHGEEPRLLRAQGDAPRARRAGLEQRCLTRAATCAAPSAPPRSAGSTPPSEIALRAHLDGCAACRAELRELTLVARALDAVPISASRPRRPSRRARSADESSTASPREREQARSRRVRRVAGRRRRIRGRGGGRDRRGRCVLGRRAAIPPEPRSRCTASAPGVDERDRDAARQDRGHRGRR